MDSNGSLDVVRQINLYLARTGKRQYELAGDLGIPPTTINRWLKKKSRVSKAYQIVLKAKGIIP